MRNNISFEKLHNKRKEFLVENKNKDHIILSGTNNILISTPHGVSQVRLGKLKVAEIGALTTALQLKNLTNCHLIAKTKNNNDDANFDERSKYKDSIKKLIKQHNIKYIIDIHGLASHRECDINLGTHLGNNISADTNAFNLLNKLFLNNDFTVSIDQPFMAGSRTISGGIKNEFPNMWTLQIEINCGITNKKENYEEYKKLINILKQWIIEIEHCNDN